MVMRKKGKGEPAKSRECWTSVKDEKKDDTKITKGGRTGGKKFKFQMRKTTDEEEVGTVERE